MLKTESNVRGELPPIAATLNKVLKRDAPGGPSELPGASRLYPMREDHHSSDVPLA